MKDFKEFLTEKEDQFGMNIRMAKETPSVEDIDYKQEMQEMSAQLEVLNTSMLGLENLYKPLKNTSALNLMSDADKKKIAEMVGMLQGMMVEKEVTTD